MFILLAFGVAFPTLATNCHLFKLKANCIMRTALYKCLIVHNTLLRVYISIHIFEWIRVYLHKANVQRMRMNVTPTYLAAAFRLVPSQSKHSSTQALAGVRVGWIFGLGYPLIEKTGSKSYLCDSNMHNNTIVMICINAFKLSLIIDIRWIGTEDTTQPNPAVVWLIMAVQIKGLLLRVINNEQTPSKSVSHC